MVYLKKFLLFEVIFLAIIIGEINSTSLFEPSKLKVHIRMDKRTYFQNDDILLKIFVKNMSVDKNYFYIYDSSELQSADFITFQPQVYDLKGKETESIVKYRLENTKPSEVISGLTKRLIELAPGESFVAPVYLNKIFKFDLKKKYRVKAHFYPDFTNDVILIGDNELCFTIVPEKILNNTGSKDKISRFVTPGETVFLALRAEKERDWNNFIKYINIEKFINSYSDFVMKYYKSNTEEKIDVENKFKIYLTRDRDDYLLDYKLVSEEVEPNGGIAYVDAVIDRFGIKKTWRYRYKYTLEQYNNIWLITDQEATVMKGKKR
jgi:hypothetical protein